MKVIDFHPIFGVILEGNCECGIVEQHTLSLHELALKVKELGLRLYEMDKAHHEAQRQVEKHKQESDAIIDTDAIN